VHDNPLKKVKREENALLYSDKTKKIVIIICVTVFYKGTI